MATRRHGRTRARTFLCRLARDRRGNTLAIMAAALIPLAGMVGGGIDLSRMYIVKTRLQHACDAGALAGRKTMGGGQWSQTVRGVANFPKVQANKFFDANYDASAYGATGVTREFTESAGRVRGSASATVPMTLMRVFGKTQETLTVGCDAEMRLPNTDVMFVLDTTKSMICAPSATQMFCSDAGSNSRMTALRLAVKCFYQIVARLDVADADCEGDEPSGGTGSEVQIRFGFVPYATNVNVGRLLPTSYFPDSWNYQTRQPVYNSNTTYTFPNPGTAIASPTTTTADTVTGAWANSSETRTASRSSSCPTIPNTANTVNGTEGAPYNSNTVTAGSVQTVTYNTKQSYRRTEYQLRTYTNGTCYYNQRTVTYNLVRSYTRVDTGVAQVTYTFASWNYGQLPVNIGLLKNGTAWRTNFTLPIGNNGANKTIGWDGCIEERRTIRTTNFSTISADADDLDIDAVPTTTDINSQWKPVLPDLVYTRRTTTRPPATMGEETVNWNRTAHNGQTTNYTNTSVYSCPSEARKLQAWTVPADFQAYVNGLIPDGATYHDIGLLWGARLMSPTGLFAQQNALTPDGGEIERHLIFMTDGDTNANDYDYAAYGIPWFDRRQTADASVPTKAQLDQQVNLRFAALCTAIKNMNITLWVISFGASVNSESEDRLEACATDEDHYFSPAESSDLQKDFRSIADKISQLRLTR